MAIHISILLLTDSLEGRGDKFVNLKGRLLINNGLQGLANPNTMNPNNVIHFKTLRNTVTKEILGCFNCAFSDYSIPLQLNLEQLETKLRTENINKDISIGAFNGNRLVGFVLHGDREKDGGRIVYNAGTGVIPSERGQKLTRRMYEYIMPMLVQNNFSEVVLEVIADNEPAIKSYQTIGFNKSRDLCCFKGELSIGEKNDDIVITQSTDIDFDKLAPFCDIHPTWQNAKETILNLGDHAKLFQAFLGDELCGYCIMNSRNNRILQIAVNHHLRKKGIGSSLLHAVKSKLSEQTSIINVESSSEETIKFLESCNLQNFLNQMEMKLSISRDYGT